MVLHAMFYGHCGTLLMFYLHSPWRLSIKCLDHERAYVVLTNVALSVLVLGLTSRCYVVLLFPYGAKVEFLHCTNIVLRPSRSQGYM